MERKQKKSWRKLGQPKFVSGQTWKAHFFGCCCGAVGRVVASNASDLQFDSAHQKHYLQNITMKKQQSVVPTSKKRSYEPDYLGAGN